LYYKTHMVSSICLGAGVSILLNYPFHIIYVIGLTLGSLLPDIDEPKSYIGRRSFGIAHFINVKFGHRGFTHSLLAWLILSYICVFFWSPLAVGISFGYLFHLFLLFLRIP